MERNAGGACGSSLDAYGRASRTTSLSLSLFPVAARVTVDTGVEPDIRGFLVVPAFVMSSESNLTDPVTRAQDSPLPSRITTQGNFPRLENFIS